MYCLSPMTGIRINSRILIGALVVLAILLHIPWFAFGTILTHGDWQFRADQHIRDLFSHGATWLSFTDFGGANITLYSYPLRSLLWPLVVFLGFSYDIAIKVTLFMPIAILGFVAPFLLARRLTKNQWIALGVALFYGSTTYFLRKQTNHLPLALIYSLTPLILMAFMDALKFNTLARWTVVALTLALVAMYDLRIIVIVGLVLVIYFVIFHLNLQDIKRYARQIIFVGILFGLLSAYWFLPTIFGGLQGAVSSVAERGLFGNELFSLPNALTLHEYSWTGAKPNLFFISQAIPWFFWILPFAAFSVFLFVRVFSKREIRLVIFFAVVALIGIFLTKQSDEPFAFFYKWAYDTIPGFSLFREASKFYLLTAFGYAGMLAFWLLGVRRTFSQGKARYMFAAAIMLVVVCSAANLKPLATGEIGTLFVSRQMPDDYQKLSTFLSSQKEYFRTYWVPNTSRWNFYSNTHPQISGAATSQSVWKDFSGFVGSSDDWATREAIIRPFNQPYSNNLFDDASVRYVIVPLRDTQNDDDFFVYYGNDRQYFISELDNVDFLKRVDLGLKNVVVYENEHSKPPVSSFSRLYELQDISDVGWLADFGSKALKDSSLNFTADLANEVTATRVRNIFKDIGPANIDAKASRINVASPALKDSQQAIYSLPKKNIHYSLENNIFRLVTDANYSIGYDGTSLKPAISPEEATIRNLEPGASYYLHVDNHVVPLADTKGGLRFITRSSGQVRLLRPAGTNLVRDPSFEEGQWQSPLRDCNNYDNLTEAVSMEVIHGGAAEGQRALRLGTYRHLACLDSSAIKVNAGEHYLLSFNYRSREGQPVGYEVRFGDQVLKDLVETKHEGWHQYSKLITIPAHATDLKLTLFGWPASDGREYRNTYYDNVRLVRMSTEYETQVADGMAFEKTDVPASVSQLSYSEPGYDYANLLLNPSFEEGFWQQKVSDCNAFDDKPLLRMWLDKTTSTQGRQSLALGAQRHVACTSSSPTNVVEGSSYLLSLNYKNTSGTAGGYAVAFNDPDGTTISKRLASANQNKDWTAVSEVLRIPIGATSVRLTLYGYSDGYGFKETVTHYDNVHLVKVPAIEGNYFSVSGAVNELATPKSIRAEQLSATKYMLRIEGAPAAFYLRFGDSYNKAWQLFDGREQSGVLAVPHFKLNGYLNGWYIDSALVCRAAGESCTKNEDGTYSMDLTIAFTPQRLFSVGLWVTGVTLLACIVYLVIAASIKRRQKKRKELLNINLRNGEPDGMHFFVRSASPLHVPQRPQRLRKPQRPKRRLVQ
jgi:hypothetical protein